MHQYLAGGRLRNTLTKWNAGGEHRIVRYSPSTLAYGVEERRIGGAVARVFNPAKTVADCFKFRNKIGLDVALERLRDCIRQQKATRDEIWKAAQVCRVANVIRPYMESLE